ncbi:origin recognition complex subunit 2-like [Anneissia japonica]|uniref:origin recognition complex subunit 2-like n=1 Tax=Anneissia japonica TaxID=1529436 RepID=UPI001425747A|nr:origin recognition complex subunit 2-like [Anneissia japonica]
MAAPIETRLRTPRATVSLSRLTFPLDSEEVQHNNDMVDAASKNTTVRLRSQVQTGRPQRSTRKNVSYKINGDSRQQNSTPRQNNKDRVKKPLSSSSSSSSSSADSESDEECFKHQNTPSVLLEGYEEDSKRGVVSGSVYEFKTPKRAGQMAKLAAETCTPITNKTTPLTRKAASSKKSSKQVQHTPATRARSKTRAGRRVTKRVLMDQFRNMMLQDISHLVINGFFPSITLKNILNSITEDLLSKTNSFKSPVDQINFIEETLEHSGEDVFLLINNIDGQMLRGSKVQSMLSMLAQIPQVHFVASIDHINAPLIWDQAKASRFNWLWYDVTNFEPYTEETSYENSLLVQHSGALALSSLTNVLRSLTPNARGIFEIIVNYQLENKDNSLYNGLSFQDLYQKCREAFLVNSDLTLRAQLTEFRDHKLLKSKKGIDGIEFLSVPIENATLAEFLDQQQE